MTHFDEFIRSELKKQNNNNKKKEAAEKSGMGRNYWSYIETFIDLYGRGKGL